jgi:N-acetylmuramoyl-L-alanine amidase
MNDPILFIDMEPDAESLQAPVRPGSPADILARTLYGEARGESVRGKEAVACVIMNRVRKPRWWGKSVEEVCRRPWQFSCWNRTDPNCAKIQQVDDGDRVFRICVRIAQRAIAGVIDDPTKGATHYHTRNVLPDWAKALSPSAEIGNHLFYNDVE